MHAQNKDAHEMQSQTQTQIEVTTKAAGDEP